MHAAAGQCRNCLWKHLAAFRVRENRLGRPMQHVSQGAKVRGIQTGEENCGPAANRRDGSGRLADHDQSRRRHAGASGPTRSSRPSDPLTCRSHSIVPRSTIAAGVSDGQPSAKSRATTCSKTRTPISITSESARGNDAATCPPSTLAVVTANERPLPCSVSGNPAAVSAAVAELAPGITSHGTPWSGKALDFAIAATEDERVAALQTNHDSTGLRGGHEPAIDFVLSPMRLFIAQATDQSCWPWKCPGLREKWRARVDRRGWHRPTARLGNRARRSDRRRRGPRRRWRPFPCPPLFSVAHVVGKLRRGSAYRRSADGLHFAQLPRRREPSRDSASHGLRLPTFQALRMDRHSDVAVAPDGWKDDAA